MADYLGMVKSDHNIVRDYIMARDEEHYAGLPEDMVAIIVTHSNLPSMFLDLRFDLHTTIEGVKERFRKHFGTPVDYQRLQLKIDDMIVCEMKDNSKMLGYYSVESGNIVHVIDEDPYSLSRGGGLTDVSLVQKYKMDEQVYDSRKGTVRSFIKEKKAKEALEKKLRKEAGIEEEVVAPPGLETVAHVTENGGIGARCEVMPGSRRGVIRWIGECEHLKPGYWVGVQFDEPVGKSDGSVKNTVLDIQVTLFECSPGFGGFVRGKNICVGAEYTEVDPFADEAVGESKDEGQGGEEEEEEL